MDRRFYRLGQFLGCYFGQDWPHFYGTTENALEAGISEYPLKFRQQVRQELAALLGENHEPKEFSDILNYGLGVAVHFKHPKEARAFAEHVETKLMTSIKAEFERDTSP